MQKGSTFSSHGENKNPYPSSMAHKKQRKRTQNGLVLTVNEVEIETKEMQLKGELIPFTARRHLI
jgi:hypothetical protein